MNSSDKLVLSDWNWRTPILDMQILEGSKFDYKKNWSWKTEHFETLKIRSIHEIGELKRAQELRVEDFLHKN